MRSATLSDAVAAPTGIGTFFADAVKVSVAASYVKVAEILEVDRPEHQRVGRVDLRRGGRCGASAP